MLLYQSQAHARATAEQYRALGSALPAGGERRGRVGAGCAEAKLHLIFCRVTLRCPFPARYLAFSRMEFFDKLYTSMSTSCPDSDLTVVNLNGIPFFFRPFAASLLLTLSMERPYSADSPSFGP